MTIPSNAWQREAEENSDFVAVYNEFFLTDAAKQYVPNFGAELDNAQQYIANNEEN